jgi:uncharacterized protein
VKFEWDDEKARANLKKHGVSFGEATGVFFDPNAIGDYDSEHSDEERRFFIIGMPSRRPLYVVYAERAGDMVRIISARKADKAERQNYERASNP